MKYKLDISNRIMLLSMLPPFGEITTLRLVSELRETLSFTEKELKDHNIKSAPSGQTTWDKTNAKPKSVEIGEVMTGVIQVLLTSLNEDKKLQEAHISLWDIFFPIPKKEAKK